MSASTPILRRLVPAFAVAVGLLTAMPARAATAAAPEAETLIVEAEAALGDERWAEAGDGFRHAYDRMSGDERRGDLGEHVVTEAVAAYDAAYRKDGNSRYLVHAQDLLQSAARDRGGALPSSELRAELVRITALLEKVGEPGDSADDPPQARPASESPADSQPTNGGGKRVDGGGVALVTVGAVLAGTGIGLLANGATLPDRAQDQLDDRGGSAPGDDAYLDDARRLRTGYVAAGAVGMGAGVALVIWGAVRLARHRRAAPRTTAGPSLNGRAAGLWVRVRF